MEFQLVAGFKVEQMPVLEIAGEHPARLFGRVDAVDIGQRLSLCLAEVEAARFLFDEQRARPEQVHETMFVAEQFDPLFIDGRSEEHTSELQSLMRISYAVFCLK